MTNASPSEDRNSDNESVSDAESKDNRHHLRRETSSCCSGSCSGSGAIPEQLAGKHFIRLREKFKQPIKGDGAKQGPHFDLDDPALAEHIDNGGNAARVCRDNLVVLDIDSEIVAKHSSHLPDTLTISTSDGAHRWFKCQGIDSRISLSHNNTELGSIRTGHDYALVPPSIHPSGTAYEIRENREIATVSQAALLGIEAAVMAELDRNSPADSTAPHRTAEGAAAAPSFGGSGAVADRLSFIDHDERRKELVTALRNPEASHDERFNLVHFLFAVVGVREREILSIIDEYNQWKNYDAEITHNQVRSVIEWSDYERGGWS